MPSIDSCPSAGRKATWAGSEVVVAAPEPLTVTPVVASGSSSSNTRPLLPFSSPNTMVPQAVRCTGSQLVRPELKMFATAPAAISMRCNATLPLPCSLQAMRCVGLVSLGHNAIMSMFAPRFASALTTLAVRPLASVTRPAGLALAAAADRLVVDDAPSGLITPNRLSDWAFASSSTFCPKSTANALVEIAVVIASINKVFFIVHSLKEMGPAQWHRKPGYSRSAVAFATGLSMKVQILCCRMVYLYHGILVNYFLNARQLHALTERGYVDAE